MKSTLSAPSVDPIPFQSEGEFYAFDQLDYETEEFLHLLRKSPIITNDFETRFQNALEDVKGAVEGVEKKCSSSPTHLSNIQEGFRRNSQDVFFESPLFRRTRTWPEGYPADYLTLEAIYQNIPNGESELGKMLDRYFLSLKLTTAIRQRNEKLSELLKERSKEEKGQGQWLNIACGSCRELVSIKNEIKKVFCVDYDLNSLKYAKGLLLNNALPTKYEFIRINSLSFVDGARNIERFGDISTIYSPGLFDYLPDGPATKLIQGMYDSLIPGGVFFASFLDKSGFNSFESHWLTRWTSLFRRSEKESLRLLTLSGIKMNQIKLEKEESGAGLLFVIKK